MPFTTKDTFTFDHTAQADYPNWIPSITKTNMNARGEELRLALNAVVNLLNATGAGVSGAKNTAMTPILAIGTQADVQSVVEAIVTRLQAVTAGLSGAKFVGVETITGLTGNDVQTLLVALKTLTDGYNTTQTSALGTHKSSADHDTRYYTQAQVDTKDTGLAGAGRTTETIKTNYDNLVTHKTSTDHDARYYTQTIIDGKVTTLNSADTTQVNALATHKTSADHDGRYNTSALVATTAGAGLVGAVAPSGLVGTTVQALINALKVAIDSVVLAGIADGSITDVKLSNTAGQIKDTVAAHLVDEAQYRINQRRKRLMGVRY
jgi:hypothetical protein